MKKLFLLLLTVFVVSTAVASDYHQDGSTHKVSYTIIDSNGQHVSGQSPSVKVQSHDSTNFYNFSTNQWGAFNNVNSYTTMTEQANGGYYYHNLIIDQPTIVSGDYVVVVSNDDSTYADLQAETINFDNLGNLVRIHR